MGIHFAEPVAGFFESHLRSLFRFVTHPWQLPQRLDSPRQQVEPNPNVFAQQQGGFEANEDIAIARG